MRRDPARRSGSKALTVWIGDGSNFPGQSNFTGHSNAISDSMKTVTAALPDDWRIFTEHKMFETGLLFDVVQDWAQLPDRTGVGPKAFLPRRPRGTTHERQHRDDRRPADPVQEARGLPFQRFEIRRRRLRHRIDRPPTACSSFSTSSSMRRHAPRTVSIRPICSTRAIT